MRIPSVFVLVSCMSSIASAMSLPASSSSTAVIGVGVLGTSLCRQLLEAGEASVVGITKSTDRHESIRSAMGDLADRLHLVTSADDADEATQYRNVVFCAPPSGFEDYPSAVGEAINRYWDKNADGLFVFTSSGAVYGDGQGSTVDESTPVADPDSSPRVGRLIKAEQACLQAGGCCLRLAGLYNLQRGAHNYYLTAGKDIPSRPDGLVNLLHYDDAAGACVAALKVGPSVAAGKAFLISDGHPLTREQLCTAALQATVYADAILPKFTGTESALGKVYDGTLSNKLLQWKPQWESFDAFMKSHA